MFIVYIAITLIIYLIVLDPESALNVAASRVDIKINPDHQIFSSSTFFALMNYYLSTAVKGECENAWNVVTNYAASVMKLHFSENLNMYALPERWSGTNEDIDANCTGLIRVASDAGMPPNVLHEFVTSPEIQEKFKSDTHKTSEKFKETLNLKKVPYTVIDNQNDPSKPKVLAGTHSIEILEEYLKKCCKQ